MILFRKTIMIVGKYIIIILQPKAQNWFFTASVLRQKLRRAIINYESF